MANLTSTAQQFKKIGPIVLIGLIIFVLIGLIIYRFTRKSAEQASVPITPPSITQNPEQKQPRSFDFSNTQIPDTPKELPIYIPQAYNITEAAATTIASKLGFSGEPSTARENTLDGKEFSWSQGDFRLTLSQTSIEYRDLSNQSQAAVNESKLTLDQLKAKVESFLSSVTVLGGDLSFQNTVYQTTSNGRGYIAENFEKAQLVEFSFGKQLSGLPIIDNYSGSALTTTTITKNGIIRRFISRFFETFPEKEIYKLKSAKEAIGEVQKGQGRIVRVRVDSGDGQPPSFEEYEHPEKIDNAKIEKVSLAYFLPSDIKELIQPIFVFEGSFQSAKGENGKVVIYLPAIKSNK